MKKRKKSLESNLSNCCKARVRIETEESDLELDSSSYYVCTKCHKVCGVGNH